MNDQVRVQSPDRLPEIIQSNFNISEFLLHRGVMVLNCNKMCARIKVYKSRVAKEDEDAFVLFFIFLLVLILNASQKRNC